MEWAPNTVELLPGDWYWGEWTQSQYTESTRPYKCHYNAVWIVEWSNKRIKHAWRVGRPGWTKLADFAMEHTQQHPPTIPEESPMPRHLQSAMKKTIPKRQHPAPFKDELPNPQRWEWLKLNANINDIAGFWLASKLMVFDPRSEQEIEADKQAIRMGPPQRLK